MRACKARARPVYRRAILRALLAVWRALLGLSCHRAAIVAQFRACLAFSCLVYAQWARACPVSFVAS